MITSVVGRKRELQAFLVFATIAFSLISGLPSATGQSLNNERLNGTSQAGIVFEHPLPTIKDPRLKVEIVADGLTVPTGMAFLDKDNILVLKRYSGTYVDPLGGITTVNIVTNGNLREEPVLRVLSGICDISNPQPGCSKYNERGLLGIATSKINNSNPSTDRNVEVFLYYTEITLTGQVLGNRVYKYLWDGNRLVNPVLILDLPAKPGPNHNSGKVVIGPDNYLYTMIGDQGKDRKNNSDSGNFSNIHNQVQNVKGGDPADNTSGIFRVNSENGLPAPDNPFINNSENTNDTNTLNRYFAYGFRNSFGLAFDPLTGNLWDTENGPEKYDEINLVKPGFNSGWIKVVGPMSRKNMSESDLVNLPGSKYSDPEFSWKNPIGVTDLEFLNSSKLGQKYRNNLFVGDFDHGDLYFFKLNKNRDGLEFSNKQSDLIDLVADDETERLASVLGSGFDIITDIVTGPDGYLYILSYSEYPNHRDPNISRIYRIVPAFE